MPMTDGCPTTSNASLPSAAPASAGLGVAIHQLSRTFPGGVKAIDTLDLTITPGSFVAILGPSGCGKSTLLRLIAQLDQPTQGRIEFLPSASESPPAIAYVFQDAHLLPWRNVWRNVALPLELAGVSQGQRKAQAMDALARVGLADAVDRYPAQLSGGMRMRVSLARALVTSPRLLLLDEPFAALDEITRQQLDQQLYQLWRETGMTVIFVTHSTAEAAYLAQRAVVFSRRPARMVHDDILALPEARPQSIRGQADFAAATARLYDALERGEQTS